MSDWLDIGTVGWLVLAIIAAAGVVALVLVARRARSGVAAEPEAGGLQTRARLAVLESAPVDSGRRLVLVRCDRVEHLLLIGGAADIVVDGDVGKIRLAGSRAVAESGLRRNPPADPPLVERADAAPRAAAVGETVAGSAPADNWRVEPARLPQEASAARQLKDTAAEERSADTVVHPAPPRPPLAAVPSPAQTQIRKPAGPILPAPPLPRRAAPEETAARLVETQPAAESLLSRQDAKPESRIAASGKEPAAARPPTQAPAIAAEKQKERPRPPQPSPKVARPASAPTQLVPAKIPQRDPAPDDKVGIGETPGLPSADVPWPETDGLENEISQALRRDQAATASSTDPVSSEAAAEEQESPAALGDLAERLEEALAREIHATTVERRVPDAEADEFKFTEEKPAAKSKSPPAPAPAAAIAAPKTIEPKRPLSPAPQAEPKRDLRAADRQPADRQDDTPVINLNARRREAVDPLEDEMARLLGELTGDTSRR